MTAPDPKASGAEVTIEDHALTDTGERIALNAACLRLFKGEYHDSGDRHSDALFVRDGLGVALASLAAKEAENQSLRQRVEVLREALEGVFANLNAMPEAEGKNMGTWRLWTDACNLAKAALSATVAAGKAEKT